VFDRDRVASWALERLATTEGARWDRLFEAIGLEANGELVAAAVFTDYVPRGSITVHLAAAPQSLWALPGVIRAGLQYAFYQCGVRRITAVVAERNVRCQKFIERLGFQREGVIRNSLPDQSEMLYGLLREECRFLE
jgi:RimJ/RimL family protein N-acetyltransferase